MPIKKPTLEEYLAYDGAHCHQLWRLLTDLWKCPGCGRTKYEIMRWTTRYTKRADGSRSTYKGWMAGLHKHHDHSQGFFEFGRGRFLELVVCDQCNSADGIAKRSLGLPADFSFSPAEISQFITASAHGKHKINVDNAREIYASVKEKFGRGSSGDII